MALQLLVISGSPSGGPRPNRSGGEKERLMKRNLVKILLVLAVCSLPMIASAGVLDGQSGTLYYYYPSFGSIYTADAFTAPATVITLTYGPDLPNVIGGNTIFITFGNVGYTFNAGSFNGEDFNFPGLNITSVVYMSNFTSTWGWDAQDVWVNWQGLTPGANSFVSFQIGTTPEPGSMILLGSGVLGIAGLLRRKLNI